MRIQQAKQIARHWINEEAITLSGFAGAFFHGSITWLDDNAMISPSSDVDIMVVFTDAAPQIKLGKFCYRDVLLEVSYLSIDELRAPEQVLRISHLAGSFRTAGIIADPSGQLTILQKAVSANYAKRQWVEARCQHAIDKILGNLQSLQASAPFHDQVTSWLFATGVTTHVLLVAGLKNPTVRTRYVAVKQLLAEYGYNDFYEPLLDLLGCAQMNQSRCALHLAALTEVFNVAKTIIKTPFFFASDLSDVARPIAIEGSQALIDQGLQREAIFWMVATYSRCQKVLYHDAPIEIQERFAVGYRALLADLGIHSSDDLRVRGEQIKTFLPKLREMAEAIMDRNLEIVNDSPEQ